MSTESKITVALVDDSSVIRRAVARILEDDPAIEIIGSVPNGELGVSLAGRKKPDVMILDVEMPVMDGLTALPKVLEVSPDTQVIMFSSLTAKGADTTMKAMRLGAVECLVKPSSAQDTGPNSPFKDTLLNVVKTLGRLNKPKPAPEKTGSVAAKQTAATPSAQARPAARPKADAPVVLRQNSTDYTGKPSILAIGSSTGGPQALFSVLKELDGIDIPIVITQHMPATFTKILAEHISQQTNLQAVEGEDGMTVEPGKVYVAPGGKHMIFEKNGLNLTIKLDDGEPENFCKPAVDPMLRSLISIYGKRVLCTILTGMGHDGLQGCRALTEAGGRVIAQNKETSVVWGMPGAVATDGLCSAVLPLNEIGGWLKKASR